MKEAKIIIIGFGIIGQGFAEVLLEKDLSIQVVAVCEKNGSLIDKEGLDLEKALSLAKENNLPEHPSWQEKSTTAVIEEMDADAVIELTPGNIETGEPGLTHIEKALENEMHVVTSNKSPIALEYGNLHETAREHKVKLRYEASVGGAIPILNLKRCCLQVNEIKALYGILNGTTNYVLTKMFEEGVEFEDALAEAQEIGIAEPDPTYDIEGIDSAVKATILSNSLMKDKTEYEDIRVKGIKEITQESVELAKKHGYVIKLISDIKRKEVSPRLIPTDHPLNVPGSLNAVMVETDVAGPITLIGKGAGPRETASSLFSDLLEVLG